jgi:hypothetical protein
MEAAATPLHRPQVRTLGDRLVVDSLVVSDPCARRLVEDRERSGDDPARVVVDAIEIGARVLDREQTVAQTDFVRAEFEKQAREVDRQFAERAGLVTESLTARLDTIFAPETGQLSRALGEHFGDGSSSAVQHKVRALVEQANREAQRELQRSLASDSGLLADFKRGVIGQLAEQSRRQDTHLQTLAERQAALQRELQGLRDEKQRLVEVAAAHEKGTAKGRTFEEAVYAALDAIASGQGDVCDAVGDFTGAGGKKGDVVVELDGCGGPARGRVVFEVKDSRLSRPKAIEVLDVALAQRGADYAVLVVRTEDEVPAKLTALREFNGDKLVVAYDPEEGSRLALEVAYKLARGRVMLARAGDDGLDATALRDKVERAVGALDEARNAKRELTNASGAIERARGSVEALEDRVRARLGDIDALLTAAA